CHSSHSKSLAAKRMGQQVLQGLHLVPLPGLHCLNDTRLQPTHMLIDLFPWNGMPVRGDVGSSTSRRVRRHLHRPLDRFLKFSRSSTPQRSQPAFASGDVATRIPPLQGGIRFLSPPYPHHHRVALRLSYLPFGRSDTGLPRSARLTSMG